MASPPIAEKLMEQLRALQGDKNFHCLKSNDQKIWEEGYAGQVPNKCAGSEQVC